MAGLKTLLGLFPKTSEYELKRKQLEDEYMALDEFETSDELAHFKELEQHISSEEFKNQQNDILKLSFKSSDEFRKETLFKSLQKDREIKLFLKTKNSPQLALSEKLTNSDKLKKYNELKTLTASQEFILVKAHYKKSGKARFKESDLGKTYENYIVQSKSSQISAYKKFISHKLYNNFSTLDNSDKIKRYYELKTIVSSGEFAQKKATLKKDDFLSSEEGKNFLEYKNLAGKKEIKNYEKLAGSPLKKAYDKIADSNELAAFIDMEKFIQSADFKQQKSDIEKKTFKDTEEFIKEQELQALNSDPELRAYFKFVQSKEFANYNAVKDSDKLEKYYELEKYIQSEAFIEKKKYLSLSPKVRWSQSEEFAKFSEFEALKKSEKITWYFSNKGHSKFNWLKTWKITFEDDFDTGKLDRKKWLTRYFWGEEMLQDSYSLDSEKHCFTDGDNLQLNGSIIKIDTRKENAVGKVWNPSFGFAEKEFEYTSGIINTGNNFWQKYGLFEVKVKVSSNLDILNAVWMVGERMTPHINILNALKKCSLGVQYDEQTAKKKTLGRNRFSGDFHIISIEWNENQIIWRINGLDVITLKNNIPQEPMYLSISSGIYKDIKSGLPATMEIDWVKCYEKVN